MDFDKFSIQEIMGKYIRVDMKDLANEYIVKEAVDKKRVMQENNIKKEKTYFENFKFNFKWIIWVVFFVIAVVLMLKINQDIININNTTLGWKVVIFSIITIGFIFISIYLRDKLFKYVIFAHKNEFLKRYYNCLNGDEKIVGAEDIKLAPEKDIMIPLTDNGAIIGILESLLYSIAVIAKSPVLIGIVLAVRSYVSVSSHKNKEESEFYIMGLLGSLLFSIIMTFIYILVIDAVLNINLFEVVEHYKSAN